MVIINPVPLPPYGGRAYNHITPFTYRDGLTFVEVLEQLRAYIRDTVVPHVDMSFDGLEEYVDTAIAETQEWTQDSIDSLTGYVNNIVQAIIDDSIEVQDPVVAGLMADPDSDTRVAGDGVYVQIANLGEVVNDFVNVPSGMVVPSESSHAAIQAALDEAYAQSTGQKTVKVVAAGRYSTDETLVIRSDADLSRLTIDYTGTGVAVQVGLDTELIQNIDVTTPKIVNDNNTVGTNWVGVGGSIGLRIVNVSSSRFRIPYVAQFETGWTAEGTNGRGNAYNTFDIGNLYNNKRNHIIKSDGVGWTTQNLYLNGRFAHATAEGVNVTGVEQILVEATVNPSRNATSNNLFLNTSIEGATPQYHLSIAGRYNVFINPRLEVGGAPARIRFHDDAQFNEIFGGYGSHDIERFIEGDSSANIIRDMRGVTYVGNTSAPSVRIEKAGLSTAYIAGFPGGWSESNGDFAEWIYQITGRWIEGRRQGDAFPRVRIDWYDGQIRVGDGTVEPAQGVRAHVNGTQIPTSLVMSPTNDIGVGLQKPRYVYASTAHVLPIFTTANRPATPVDGATIIDSTINKTITYYKTAWRDANGEIV